VYAENEDTLMSILDSYSIRTRKEVRRSEVVIGRMIYPSFSYMFVCWRRKRRCTVGINCRK